MFENGAPGGPCTHTLPADNGLLFCSATGAMKWWEALVMLQSSLPTFIFRHWFYRPAAGTPPEMKFEVRNKLETRIAHSNFGFRICFEFRVSGFEFLKLVAGTGVAPVEAEFMRLA